MGILDEAIREHLELKRKHGAEQEELRKLEDEAFGPAERPGDFAQPDAGSLEAAETQVLSQTPGVEPEQPSGFREPGTSEREAIAAQPTEVFDVASELAREKGEERAEDEVEPPEAEAPQAAEANPAEPVGEPAAGAQAEAIAVPELEVPPPPPESATEEEPVDDAEPQAGAPEPMDEGAADTAEVVEADPQVFDEQSLAEELDQPLEGPTDREQRRAAFFEETDEYHAPPQRPARQADFPETSEHFPETSENDVLEDTPDFLEETPEHDRLWFEQKPPKDFDFND